MTTDELDGLIAMARVIAMTGADREAQRRSFVYGNARLANEEITWETIGRPSIARGPSSRLTGSTPSSSPTGHAPSWIHRHE